jgi:hypothetical protein
MSETQETTRSHCNSCSRETKHLVLGSRRIDGSDELQQYGTVTWWDKYELLECGGCEHVSMRHTSFFEFDDEPTAKIYPPMVTRKRPPWISEVPTGIGSMMEQVYGALDSNSRGLAVMGSRAVMDMLLTDKVGDVGSFGEKLDNLVSSGIVGAKNRAFLEAALDAGSAAAHRGHEPTVADVQAVIDIVENLLQASYHLGTLAKRLKKSTPKRKKVRNRRGAS